MTLSAKGKMGKRKQLCLLCVCVCHQFAVCMRLRFDRGGGLIGRG